MSDEPLAIAWDPEPGSASGAAVIYGTVFAVGVLVFLDQVSGLWNLAVLVPGWLVIGAVAWLLEAPARYTLTSAAIERSCRGRSEVIPLVELTTVFGFQKYHVGDCIELAGRDLGFELNLGSADVDKLLKRVGPLLVTLGTDRKVIADEKTRRWLGLAGGGLRDPWTPTE